MSIDDEDYLFECIEDIQRTVHENNFMLKQICHVINVHLSRHNQENEDDFMRNILANLISSGVDISGLLGRKGK